MIRNIIFDLDGTLLNTLDDLATSVNHALRLHGLPERSVAEIRHFLGNGIRNLVQRSVPVDCSEHTFEAVLQSFRTFYLQHSLDQTRPYAGVPALLATLKARGVHTAIVSNKLDTAVQELYRHFFADTIDLALGEQGGLARKPSPDLLLAAMQQLSAPPEETLYVGDSEVDWATARAAQVRCALVLWGFRDAPELHSLKADAYLNAPHELLTLI